MFVPRQIRKNKQDQEDQDSKDVDLDPKENPKGKENAPDPSSKENGEPKEQEKENTPEPKGKERASDLKEPDKSYSTQSAFFQCSYHHAIPSYHQHIRMLID